MNKIITWLEHKALNHAAIVLLSMYPFIKFNELIGSNEWAAAFMLIFIYYSREVTSAQKSGRDVKAFWPGNWPTNHDKLQTLYLSIVALLWAFIYSLML